jgi:hypothetical protein
MDTPRHHAILLCNTAKNSVLIVVIPKTQVWIHKKYSEAVFRGRKENGIGKNDQRTSNNLQNPCKRWCYGRVRHLLVALDMLTLLHVSMTYIYQFYGFLLNIRVWYHVRPRNHMTFVYTYIMLTCRVPLIDVSLFRNSRVYKCFVNHCLSVCLFTNYIVFPSSICGFWLLLCIQTSVFGIATIKTEF